MTASFRKYLFVASLNWRQWLAYRLDFFLDVSFNLIPTIIIVLVWTAVFAARPGGTVGPYTVASAVTYSLLTRFMASLLAADRMQDEMVLEIRQGGLSRLLVRPIDAMGYRLTIFVARGAAYGAAVAVPNAAVFWLLRAYLVPPAGPAVLILALWSCVQAVFLAFALGHLAVILAFWWEEVSSALYLERRVVDFFAGAVVPLDLMPPGVTAVMGWLPFQYLAYFPVKVYLGQLTAVEMARGLAMQAGWAIALFVIGARLWRAGLRRFTAAGI